MDFLSKIFRRSASKLVRLPSGSFTVDREGHVITYTLPQSFPKMRMQEIGQVVLDYFRSAQLAQMPVREMVVNYPSLKLTARELRGGAIVFLAPQNMIKS